MERERVDPLGGGLLKPLPATDFALRGEHITLDALLKASGLAGSGGAAKVLIADGGVRVNGETENRRGRKLRGGATRWWSANTFACRPACRTR